MIDLVHQLLDRKKMPSLVEVGQPDGLGETLVDQRLHGRPGLHVVRVHVRAVVALGGVASTTAFLWQQ